MVVRTATAEADGIRQPGADPHFRLSHHDDPVADPGPGEMRVVLGVEHDHVAVTVNDSTEDRAFHLA